MAFYSYSLSSIFLVNLYSLEVFILGSCSVLSFCSYLCYGFEYYVLFGKVLLLNGNKLRNINSPKFPELSGLEVCILCLLTTVLLNYFLHRPPLGRNNVSCPLYKYA